MRKKNTQHGLSTLRQILIEVNRETGVLFVFVKLNTHHFWITSSPEHLENKRLYRPYRSHKTFIKATKFCLEHTYLTANGFRSCKSWGERGNGTYVINFKYRLFVPSFWRLMPAFHIGRDPRSMTIFYQLHPY